MKHPIIAFLFCFGLLHSLAADEPLIPAALNAVLPKIHVGMTIREVEAALAPAYPKVKGQMGRWSFGQGRRVTSTTNSTSDTHFPSLLSPVTGRKSSMTRFFSTSLTGQRSGASTSRSMSGRSRRQGVPIQMTALPIYALQRIQPLLPGCNSRFTWAGLLSLER